MSDHKWIGGVTLRDILGIITLALLIGGFVVQHYVFQARFEMHLDQDAKTQENVAAFAKASVEANEKTLQYVKTIERAVMRLEAKEEARGR